ncbi:Alanine--glyoxylate aminotransferase 2-like protein 1 [Hibiscus syriacus]|uniref:alanine--glyoxylate transaminase n=1 Tax=Hibiscus syriacus TaxID=106335 RepID=A0A6A2XWS3_HIBSY|nr:Alanine--glyoxylate aminotransferase 2-like protein 1 [Hibiscus syriacus]
MNPGPFRGVFGPDATRYAKEGVGGAVELAPGYLKQVYDIVRKAGGVCIADEVQTGFGRTGSHYWGFETQGVIPDIVTMAKGIGNGLPLGAVVTTPEIASVMAQKIQFNTFGGNPGCSAGGLAVLRVIDKERQAHCADVGSHLIGRLRSLQDEHDKLGVLLGKGGLRGNVFRIKPPMCFTKDDAGRSFSFSIDFIAKLNKQFPKGTDTQQIGFQWGYSQTEPS